MSPKIVQKFERISKKFEQAVQKFEQQASPIILPHFWGLYFTVLWRKIDLFSPMLKSFNLP
jgi:pyridoxine/pyridoxamine 5'-phosphate oxidase